MRTLICNKCGKKINYDITSIMVGGGHGAFVEGKQNAVAIYATVPNNDGSWTDHYYCPGCYPIAECKICGYRYKKTELDTQGRCPGCIEKLKDGEKIYTFNEVEKNRVYSNLPNHAASIANIINKE